MLFSIKRTINLLKFGFKMSTFVSRTSPVTGKQEWIMQSDNYDFHQEVARSAYADMLHDTERNQKYAQALQMAINEMHSRGKPALVLDIGTGTGLLSMMAARFGADRVTACEAFEPMANCAKEIIKDNGLEEKINLISKRSTSLTAEDMNGRANILVTEVFDTELIGEGAINTFHHARTELLQDDCIVVPSVANVFAQVVSSKFFKRWNAFEPIQLPNNESVIPPTEIGECYGAASVHDLQLDQVTLDQFDAITKPICVFSFDFAERQKPLEFKRHSVQEAVALRDGHCDVVFMWWELQMDLHGDVMLSTAPRWAHPTPSDMQWRDHWMQAVYYPVSELDVKKSDHFKIHSYHDEYSLWFDLSTSENEWKKNASEMPVCVCGAHIACSRTRVGMLNDASRNDKYIKAMQKVIDKDSICLCLSDESLLPLIAAKLGARKVYTVQTNPLSRRLVEAYIKSNNLQECVQVLNKPAEDLTLYDLNGDKINFLIGEPFFNTSTLPWHNVYFLYGRTELLPLLTVDCAIMPMSVVIKAIAVNFKDLYKIRAPVVNCEGVKLGLFNKLIEEASDLADGYTKAHPLWEYPSVPLTEEFDILAMNFTSSVHGIKTLERNGYVEFCRSGVCNGVAIWMEYQLDKSHSISTGLLNLPIEGRNLEWDPYTRQAVHLFKRPENVNLSTGLHWKLKHKVTFRPKTGEFDFEFAVISDELPAMQNGLQ